MLRRLKEISGKMAAGKEINADVPDVNPLGQTPD
jgi:hypothetical protein